jgi:hypothetical protein
MRVLAEAFARGNAVIVNHQQVGKTLFARVAIAGEGKGVKGLQPAMIGEATIGGFAKSQHDEISLRDVNSSE